MKVRELIRELKKMPQNLEVFTNGHDNAEWEMCNHTHSVDHCKKEYFEEQVDIYTLSWDKDWFSNAPEEWVVIRG